MKKILVIGIFLTLLIPVIATTGIANSPPTKPHIEGPTSGQSGTSYTYELCSEDPDGDDITYCIDWGDGSSEVCLGPYPSGTCVQASHSFSEGTHTIKVKARDSNQAESDEATLAVSIPKSFSFMPFLQLFFEKLLEKFTFLRILLN